MTSRQIKDRGQGTSGTLLAILLNRWTLSIRQSLCQDSSTSVTSRPTCSTRVSRPLESLSFANSMSSISMCSRRITHCKSASSLKRFTHCQFRFRMETKLTIPRESHDIEQNIVFYFWFKRSEVGQCVRKSTSTLNVFCSNRLEWHMANHHKGYMPYLIHIVGQNRGGYLPLNLYLRT